jgi:hypothetical protein
LKGAVQIWSQICSSSSSLRVRSFQTLSFAECHYAIARTKSGLMWLFWTFKLTINIDIFAFCDLPTVWATFSKNWAIFPHHLATRLCINNIECFSFCLIVSIRLGWIFLLWTITQGVNLKVQKSHIKPLLNINMPFFWNRPFGWKCKKFASVKK